MNGIEKRIRKIREMLKVTQEAFAGRIATTRAHIDSVENGELNPSGTLLALICKEYGIQEEWLHYGIGPMWIIKEEAETKPAIPYQASADEMVQARGQYPTLKTFYEGMDNVRNLESEATGYQVETNGTRSFYALLEDMAGKRLLHEERFQLSDAAGSMVADEKGVFYRYGVHDAVRFILEALSFGCMKPIENGSVDQIVSRICDGMEIKRERNG